METVRSHTRAKARPPRPPRLPPALTPGFVRSTVEALIPSTTWLEQYGRPHYGLESLRYVQQMCARAPGGGGSEARLPAGWDARRFGSAWVIFHNSELRSVRPTARRAGRPPKFPPELVERVLSSVRGERGERARIAERLKLTLTEVQSILRRADRGGDRGGGARSAGRPPHPRELGVGSVAPDRVARLAKALLTPAEWVERVGTPRYGIASVGYVYQMCRGEAIGPAQSIAHLPEGWDCVDVAGAWFIYRVA